MAYQVSTALTNVARDSHYVVANDGIAYRTLLLEGQSTNLCLQSEDFGTTWLGSGSITRTAAAVPASVMGVALDLLSDADGAAAGRYGQTVVFTGNAVKAVAVFMKRGVTPNANGNLIQLADVTATADRLNATVVWDASGVPSVTAATGTYIGRIAYANGVYRLLFSTTSVTAANTHSIRIYATTATTTETGDVYVGGVQCEDSLIPTTYIKTTTGTVTRSADSLYFPATDAPQEQTWYLRFVERGTGLGSAALGVAHIGSSTAGTAPRMLIYNSGTNFYRVLLDNGSTSSPSVLATGVAFNDLVELRVTLTSAGVVQIFQSVNGAAEVSATASSAVPLLSAWGGQRLYLNSVGTSNTGSNAFIDVKRLKGIKTLAQCRAA